MAVAVAIAVGFHAAPASAFGLEGHEIIEAAAYKRLLALAAVPGTGVPGVSGRALLAQLIATGVLSEPPCFGGGDPAADCGAAERLDLPLRYWPSLHSGAPDLVIDRQIGQQGQCQHFMANTDDSLTPMDARAGVPAALVTAAYLRCIRTAGAGFDGILRDPALAGWRIVGTYALMHALEDSFSAAHVNRDAQLRMTYLLSWELIDLPTYLLHGHPHFPAATHHAIAESRDGAYLLPDARAPDGRACRDFHNPYAVPEDCLSERAKAAVGTVVDYLVAIYRLRAGAIAEGRQASLFSASGTEASTWLAFVRDHLASVSVPAELPVEPRQALPRADVFVGVQGVVGGHTLGVGGWAAKLLFGPAAPFVLGLTGGAGYTRSDGAGQLGAGLNLALLLPLIRRFTVGAAPGGIQIVCDTHLAGCKVDAVARLGVLLIPLGDALWLGLEGPRWSWTERAIGDTWAGLSIGWSHERVPRRAPLPAEALAAWDPPRPEDVRAYRFTRATRSIYLATTAASQSENAFVGVGMEWRRDRDVWDQRAGFAPGLQVEVDGGKIEGSTQGGGLAVAPTLRAYVLPNRLALSATPALVRAGALAGRAFAVDVAGRAGVALDVGRLQLAADSPPLSYVSTARWHALPFTVRLGLRFE